MSNKFFDKIKNLKNSNFSMYVVDESEYVNSRTPITVKCKVCGNTQKSQPNNLIQYIKINSTGCRKCSIRKNAENRFLDVSEIINRINIIHGNTYTYPYINEEYSGMNNLITIVCDNHGPFKATVSSHINQQTGCKKCGYNTRRHSLKQVIDAFKKKHHDHYDYSKVVYDESTNVNSKVTIICPTHGEFEQSVASHKKGQGCPSCASNNGGVSFKALTWLEHIATTTGIHIQHAANGGEYKIPNTNYRVDGFCKETNTVYEFHGDLFHGNIHKFDQKNHNNPFRKETVGELYQLTIAREVDIRNLGYNLVTIWESEYDALNLPLQRFDVATFKRRKSLDDLETLQIELMDSEFISTEHKHTWKCKICNTTFSRNLNKARIAYRETGRVGCSVECSSQYKGISVRASEDRLFDLWDEANRKGFNLFRKNGNEYKGMNGPLSVECKGCGSSLMIRPVSVERAIKNRKSGCRMCFGKSW